MKYLLLMFLTTASLVSIPPIFAEMPTYNIDVRYEAETREIEGSEEIIFTNTGTEPLSELYIALYPNLYLKPYKNRNPAFDKRVYPVAFNPGSLLIHRIEDQNGKALPFFPDPLRGKILIVVVLPSPIPAGAP